LRDGSVTAGGAAARRRLLVIFNPVAGRNARAKLARALARLEHLGIAVTLRETGAPGDAEAFARVASRDHVDGVVIAGGDGTLNEAVNGLEDADLPLAVFPFGTENVLAREIGLPRNPERAAEIAARGPARPISVGEVVFEDRTAVRQFLLMTGIGFDAEVVEGLDLDLKRRFGKLAFLWSILVRLWRYRPVEYDVAAEGVAGSTGYRAASAIVSKARFYAGPFVLAPAADLADRSFQLALFKEGGRRAALGCLLALAGGFLHRLRQVEIATVTSARFSRPAGAPVQIDGDALGRLPISIRIADRPLLLVYPDESKQIIEPEELIDGRRSAETQRVASHNKSVTTAP
jgi:diacylglycerol kinase (ATP)